jgi:hypothetical protein
MMVMSVPKTHVVHIRAVFTQIYLIAAHHQINVTKHIVLLILDVMNLIFLSNVKMKTNVILTIAVQFTVVHLILSTVMIMMHVPMMIVNLLLVALTPQ